MGFSRPGQDFACKFGIIQIINFINFEIVNFLNSEIVNSHQLCLTNFCQFYSLLSKSKKPNDADDGHNDHHHPFNKKKHGAVTSQKEQSRQVSGRHDKPPLSSLLNKSKNKAYGYDDRREHHRYEDRPDPHRPNIREQVSVSRGRGKPKVRLLLMTFQISNFPILKFVISQF